MLNLDKNILISNSRSALASNIRLIKNQLPKSCLLSVAVKANAYGHGLVETSRELAKIGVGWLCVTSSDEGARLREANIKLPILIIGPTSDSDHNNILKHDLKTFIISLEPAIKLNNLAKKYSKIATIHLKIDTGMSRQGFNSAELQTTIQTILKLKNLRIEGIATHFATADEAPNNPAFLNQLANFKYSAEQAEQLVGYKLIKHCANSAATMLYPKSHFDLARVGIAAYGYYPSATVKKIWEKKKPKLQPVMRVYTKIVQLKNIPQSTGVSYGLTYQAKRPTKIALLPIGYFEGLSRSLSNRGMVLVNKQIAPIVGRICMDITIIDVSKIKNIKLGDRVTLIGTTPKQTLTADALAEKVGTINYEILTKFKESIYRIYES